MKQKARIEIVFIYGIISLFGFLAWHFVPIKNETFRFLFADLIMTLVCFIFSVFKKNSSVYDAYWSYIPFLFCLLWVYTHYPTMNTFHFITLGVISIWSWRLTINWLRSWSGFEHEDWRYIDLARKNGKKYPLVNFFGIHLFPTLMVFAGVWPIFSIFQSSTPISGVFIFGTIIALFGVYLEFSADNELNNFRKKTNSKQVDLLQSGLWGKLRHPNYLGEMLFWWGLAIIGNSFGAPWYTFVGAVLISLMIVFISIPLKEERMLKRKKGFKEYQKKVPKLGFPWRLTKSKTW